MNEGDEILFTVRFILWVTDGKIILKILWWHWWVRKHQNVYNWQMSTEIIGWIKEFKWIERKNFKIYSPGKKKKTIETKYKECSDSMMRSISWLVVVKIHVKMLRDCEANHIKLIYRRSSSFVKHWFEETPETDVFFLQRQWQLSNQSIFK